MVYEESSQVLEFLCRICKKFLPVETTANSFIMSRDANTQEDSVCQSCSFYSDKCKCRLSQNCPANSNNQDDNCDSEINQNSCSRCRCHSVKHVRKCSHQKFLLSPRRFSLKDSGWSTCFAVLLIGTLILPSSIMTTPVPKSGGGSGSFEHHRHHKEHANRLFDRPAKFINPCRLPATPPALQADTDIQTQPDVDIYHNIITQSKKALRQAKEFVDDFYKESFGTELQIENRYEGISYQFLADATEKMNQYNNDQLSTLDAEDQIRFLYQALQKFAVGLEAIVLDQACYGGGFYHHFNEAEYQLKYVLCELQIAMLEKNIEYTDITRDIMSQEHRDIEDKSVRDVRDFVIFRDYIKALEYVNRTFQFFHDRAQE